MTDAKYRQSNSRNSGGRSPMSNLNPEDLQSIRAGAPLGLVDVSQARDEALGGLQGINWDNYVRTGVFGVSSEDVRLIREAHGLFDQNQDAVFASTFIDEKGSQYFGLLLLVLEKITDPEVVSYALASLEKLLRDTPQLPSLVGKLLNGDEFDAKPLFRICKQEHGYRQHEAANVLALLLSVTSQPQDEDTFLNWVLQTIRTGISPPEDLAASEKTLASAVRAAVGALMVLLRKQQLREKVAKTGGVDLIAKLINKSQGKPQLLYELCFCLWTLSLWEDSAEYFFASDAVKSLCKQVMTVPREKVVRVSVAALKCLVETKDARLTELMIDAGLLKTLTKLKDRKWGDEEIATNIQLIRETLQRDYKELSSVERYAKEVKSGKLEWSLLHTDKFWRENVMQFEKEDFVLIKLLIQLLRSPDPTVLQVALFDVGEFVRFYPNGRSIVKTLGAKEIVLGLLADADPGVQKQALQCVSKMMVHNWEFVK